MVLVWSANCEQWRAGGRTRTTEPNELYYDVGALLRLAHCNCGMFSFRVREIIHLFSLLFHSLMLLCRYMFYRCSTQPPTSTSYDNSHGIESASSSHFVIHLQWIKIEAHSRANEHLIKCICTMKLIITIIITCAAAHAKTFFERGHINNLYIMYCLLLLSLTQFPNDFHPSWCTSLLATFQKYPTVLANVTFFSPFLHSHIHP